MSQETHSGIRTLFVIASSIQETSSGIISEKLSYCPLKMMPEVGHGRLPISQIYTYRIPTKILCEVSFSAIALRRKSGYD
jgi:hypothetical protein